MKMKAAVCMLALLSAPVLASAQESSPAPVPPSPVAAPTVSPPAQSWPRKSGITPADLTQLKTILAASIGYSEKQRALMETSRAKLFAAVTPAHRKAVAQIIGELAMSSTPDANAAAKQIDAVLSPQEKSAVIAADRAERAREATLRKQYATLRAKSVAFRKHLDAERKAVGWPTPAPVAQRPIAPPPAIHANWKTCTPDAGWYLVVNAQYGPRIRGIVTQPERWGWFGEANGRN